MKVHRTGSRMVIQIKQVTDNHYWRRDNKLVSRKQCERVHPLRTNGPHSQ